MVKLTGPLCSLEAHGALDEVLIYAKIGKTNYAKSYATPTNPQSAAQTGLRLGMGLIAAKWSALTDDQKNQWADLAAEYDTTPYHAYLRYNARQWSKSDCLYPAPDAFSGYPYSVEAAQCSQSGDNDIIYLEVFFTGGLPLATLITRHTATPYLATRDRLILWDDNWQYAYPLYKQTITIPRPGAGPYYYQAMLFGSTTRHLYWYPIPNV